MEIKYSRQYQKARIMKGNEMESQRTNRRQFLKKTAFAAAMPAIISSTALGKGDTPPPSERVNLGFIGNGNRGSSLLRSGLQDKQAQVVAVCDCFESRRQKAIEKIEDAYAKAGRPSNVKGYSDFKELLGRKDIDGVVIATPDHWHVPIAMYAVGAGKDVYVEKPLGVSVDYGFKLRKLIQDKKAIFQYGTQQRSSYYFRFACELARNGYIGKIESIDAWCPALGYSPDVAKKWPADTPSKTPPVGFDYQRWLGPAPVSPYNDIRVSNLGAWHIYDYALGFIAGWGAHPLDIAQWGNNTEETAPISYEGTGKINEGSLFDTLGTWDIKCKYANGVKMRFMDGSTALPRVKKYHPNPSNHGTAFRGTEGWVSVRRGAIYFSDEKLRKLKLKSTDVHLYESKNQVGNFIDCIKTRKKPVSTIEAAVQSDLISHLSNAAARLNSPVKWDPKTEKVIGDTELANSLNRKMRAPWKI